MPTLYPPLHDDKDESAPDGDDDVLSQELKDNFDAMRAALRAQSRTERSDNDLKRKEEPMKLAVKTALAAEEEMARLRNGIAELEALLAQEEGDVGIAFPSLPHVVEEEESGKTDAGELVS